MQQRMHANAEQKRCGSVAAEVRADTETVSYRTEEFLAARAPTSLKTSSHLAYLQSAPECAGPFEAFRRVEFLQQKYCKT